MSLAIGTRLGLYEVTALLGEGGMGKVWRAHHTALKRDDALKVLPDAFASDPERLARFRREAQVLASLNHPNIAHVYGLEQSDGVQALIMELVEGPTLADRIAQGPIPVDEALPIAKQIAGALEAAHEQGIIHRDLKPANIKVRPDGTVKVLDFGLAKALDPMAARVDATASPTITSPAMMTGVGVLLGTAAYMSPEQARGKAIDKRSDIWAFGCVLYEMLTGRRAFGGEDVTDTLAAVVRAEPDWQALPRALPLSVGVYLRRCLNKDPKQRVGDMQDLRLALQGAFDTNIDNQIGVSGTATRRIGTVTLAMAVSAALFSSAVTWIALRRADPEVPPVSRFMLSFPEGAALSTFANFRSLAVTPDGSRLIYVGSGGTRLWVRSLDSLEPTEIFVGAPRGPIASPDGHWVAFANNLRLQKVPLNGGPPVTIAEIRSGMQGGAAWGPDDAIVFSNGGATTGLQRVAATGGPVTVLTRVNADQNEIRHVWPEFTPDGRSVLFTIVRAASMPPQIAVLDLQTGTRTVVGEGSDARYLPTGHLLYASTGAVMAIAFDLKALQTRGAPVSILPGVAPASLFGIDAVVASNGTFVYRSGQAVAAEQRNVVWVDRNGKETQIDLLPRAYTYPRLSPDGTRIAFEVRDQAWDIWIANLASTTLTRFSFGPAPDRLPVWTPDGRRIVWSSEQEGYARPYWQAADGSGAASLPSSTTLPLPQYTSTMSPDGTKLVLRADGTTRDLMMTAIGTTPARPGTVQLFTAAESQPLIQTSFTETAAEISPDGRWIAYQSNESGRDEVYVRPFPDVNAGRWQVSTDGGGKPLWAGSSHELFYLTTGETGTVLMSAAVQPGVTFATNTPKKLFEGPYFFGTEGNGDTAFRTYDVSADGRRFLMIKGPTGSGSTTVANVFVVLNWTEELKRLVPTN